MPTPPAADLPPAAIAWLWRDAALPAAVRTVAVVDRHIWLVGDKVLTRPGARPRQLAPGTVVIPVVHVEIDPIRPPRALHPAAGTVLAAMRAAAQATTSGWVQLDLEARPSHRADYRALVRDVRAVLPPDVKLSVTALAWWCRSGAWLDGLPADEVVPMFFRMGRDNAALRGIVTWRPETLHPACRATAAGFARQEPYPAHVTGWYARTYWFDEKGWKPN